MREHRLHYGLVCKPDSQPELYDWVVDLKCLGACEEGQWHAGPICRHRSFTYRLACAVPLTALRRVWVTKESGMTACALIHCRVAFGLELLSSLSGAS